MGKIILFIIAAVITVLSFTACVSFFQRTSADTNSNRIDDVIKVLDDAPKNNKGERVISRETESWLRTELNACKDAYTQSENEMSELHAEMQTLREQNAKLAKQAGKGDFVEKIIWIAIGGLALFVLLKLGPMIISKIPW